MLPIRIICKWHNVPKSNLVSQNNEKTIPFDLFSGQTQRLMAFCDETTQKFLAKLWFQNLLAAKLSFQSLNVRVVYASKSGVVVKTK